MEKECIRRRLPLHHNLPLWDTAAQLVKKYVPNEQAVILDYCGGTGQVGQRLHAANYRRLHIVDKSTQMLQQAMMTGAYSTITRETIMPDTAADFLKHNVCKYDCVLASMSLAAYKPVYEQLMRQCIKPGGLLITLDAHSHMEAGKMTGVTWLTEGQEGLKVLLDDDSVSVADGSHEKMKILVVQRLL